MSDSGCYFQLMPTYEIRSNEVIFEHQKSNFQNDENYKNPYTSSFVKPIILCDFLKISNYGIHIYNFGKVLCTRANR